MLVCVCVPVSVCVCVCLSVCLSVWYVILEHEDKNVRTALIWRLLIAIIKTPIHILRVSFFSRAKKFKTHHNIHIFVSFDVEHNVETLT